MKLQDIFENNETKIFVITDIDNENQLNWTIEPTEYEVIPQEENYFIVKAVQISPDKLTDCYLGIITPERNTEIVIKIDKRGKTVVQDIFKQKQTIIPSVASDCFGNYELFYAKEKPQIGIDILKNGLTKSKLKSVIAEDLGYILRDEGRISEAIEAFIMSEEFGPSSEFIYSELSELFGELGQTEKQNEYKQKHKDNGGIEF